LIKEQEKLEEKTITLDKTLVELYESKKQKENNLSDVERVFYEKRSSISDLEEEISGIRRNMHQSQFLINELKEKLTDQEFGLQSVKERLKIEFNLELSDLVGIERENIPLIELEEKHDRLKRKIEIFGEVNTMAVEAYDEMNIRFETISQQKEDIIQAKKSLLKTIEEIEEIATKKYLETFEVVNGHFKKVFTRLFNEGDTCNIEMEDPDNPLESRIEITAKPKGKRPKTLNQLSGGEKTLTAIALLFSLYLFKPAPFCIFDEVDAPLDDANIEKFNRIVKEFSTDSQFIIITHNKATMTAVDVLYGVFMQEMGVSEVAAVDFRNYEELNTIVASN
jgi:chromosome segregation protein